MDELTAFVAFDQPWEPIVIDRGAVDVNRFAYVANPRQNPTATPIKATGMTDLGVILQSPAPKGVYVAFTPQFPNLSFVEWASDVAYDAGEVAYLTSTRDCYQALADVEAGGPAPNVDVERWQPVRISADFEPYLTRLAAVDFLTEDQGKFQTRAAADREFEDLCARFHEGSGENRVRTGRFVR